MIDIDYDYIKLQEAKNILEQLIWIKEHTAKIMSILEDIENDKQ